MKKQTLKIAKHALSLVLAFAVMAVSMFTAGVSVFAGSATSEKSFDTWEWDENLPATEPYWCYGDPNLEGEGTAKNPFLIKTSEQLAAVALWGGNSTKGKYYKVDDSVGVLYLCPNTDSFDASSLDALKTSLGADKDSHNATIKKWASNANYAFQGHFDGNGVIIRGMAAVGSDTQSGLFPYVKGDVSFKNVTVTDSYITSNYGVGAIVGGTTGWSDINSISFENCKVTNCYIENTRASDTAPTNTDRANFANAGLAGNLLCVQSSFIVNNCLVNANKYNVSGKQASYAFAGFIQQNNITISVSNSIADATASLTQHGYFINNESNYSNVYTLSPIDENAKNGNGTFAPTESQMKVVTAEQITGAAAKTNMPGLDWNTAWLITSGAPELRALHNLITTDNGDGTHSVVCSDCDVTGLKESHFYVINEDGSNAVCACGKTTDSITQTWDGTIATEFSDKVHDGSTTENAIIIKSIPELAYLAKGADGATAGKYYKVAACIKSFNMNGNIGVTENSTAADVAAASETGINWGKTVDNSNPFKGSFDGNGVVIYNIRCTNSWSAGLFPCINSSEIDDFKTTIKNVSVKASYFDTKSGAYTFASGAIFGAHINSSNNKGILVEKCAVVDNYIKCGARSDNNRGAGAIAGSVPWDTTYIHNCLVKGNTLVSDANATVSGGLVCQRGGAVEIKYTVVLDSDVMSANVNQWDYCTGVYTDKATTVSGVTALTTDEMTGAAALDSMTALDWNTVWFANTGTPELRVFHTFAITDNKDGTHSESCDDCGLAGVAMAHDWSNKDGVCAVCGAKCEHNWSNGTCTICGTTCEHDWSNKDGVCAVCGAECEHNWSNGTCTICGTTCEHDWSNKDGVCAVCGTVCEHDFGDGDTCTICGKPNIAPGDANGDGAVNNKDLDLLMQKLNGWDVEIDDRVADVNGDGVVNNKDYGLLMQFVNGWDVKLG